MEEISISKQVKKQINKLGSGSVFGLKDFAEIKNSQAVLLELSRLSKKGIINRLTKGKYFLPKKSKFGNLPPDEQKVLNQIVIDNGGYLGGVIALNRFGVTTQVPSQITIRGARSTRKLKIGNLNIKFTRTGNQEASNSAPILIDIIEAARLIKRTPDGNIEKTLNRISLAIKKCNEEELSELVELVKMERPYVRAIIGAQMENVGLKIYEELKSTLNPITKYKLNIEKSLLPNKDEWGII